MLSLDDFVIVTVLYSMYGRNDILRLVFNMCVGLRLRWRAGLDKQSPWIRL